MSVLECFKISGLEGPYRRSLLKGGHPSRAQAGDPIARHPTGEVPSGIRFLRNPYEFPTPYSVNRLLLAI